MHGWEERARWCCGDARDSTALCVDVRRVLDGVAQCNCTDLKWLLSITKVLIRETADLKHS